MSKDRDGLGLGVERQETECRELVAQLGGAVTRVYADNDISATSGKRRPAFEELLKDGAAGDYDAIVAWHQDRLARLPRDLDRLIDLALPVRTVTAGTLDLTTPAGRAVARTVVAWATYEGEQKAIRQRSANLQAAKAGKPGWKGKAFGWNADGTINDVEAEAIRWAGATALAGGSMREVAREFARRGLTTPQGHQWAPAYIPRLLMEPRLAGLREYQPRDYNGPIAPPLVYEGTWDAIIPRDQWEVLRAVLSAPARGPGSPRGRIATTLLGGIAVCGTCGAKMYATKIDTRRAYMCNGHAADGTRVGPRHARSAAHIDELVAELVIAYLDRPELAAAFASSPTVERDVSAELAAVRAQQDQLAEALAAGGLTMAQFLKINAGLMEKAAALTAELASAVDDRALRAVVTGGDPRAVWDATDLEGRRALIKAVATEVRLDKMPRGRFDPSSVVVTWRGTTPDPKSPPERHLRAVE